MRRYDRDGDATESYIYLWGIWSSEKISPEDKEWIDSISIKRNLKFSEIKRIEEIYEKIFDKKKNFPEGS